MILFPPPHLPNFLKHQLSISLQKYFPQVLVAFNIDMVPLPQNPPLKIFSNLTIFFFLPICRQQPVVFFIIFKRFILTFKISCLFFLSHWNFSSLFPFSLLSIFPGQANNRGKREQYFQWLRNLAVHYNWMLRIDTRHTVSARIWNGVSG